MKTAQEIIDFILSNHTQVIIEGQYTVRALFTNGSGDTLQEALNNWVINYNRNIKSTDWNLLHFGVRVNPNYEQF